MEENQWPELGADSIPSILQRLSNLESQIGDYNARASMATRNIFEDNVLPTFIDALTFIRQ